MTEPSMREPQTPIRILGAHQGSWVGVAANAASGRGAGRGAVQGLADALAAAGIEARIAWTPEERLRLVETSSQGTGCRCLVAAGGDGTVAALINERPSVPIAVLPTGTENLFARHFRADRRPEKLAAAIVAGRVASLDLGSARSRRFSLMVGIGFDADVVTRHHEARLGRTGRARPTHRAMYVEPVLRSSFSYQFPELEVEAEDGDSRETLTGATAFVFNLPRYALGLPFAPAARGDDGRLDLVVFRRPGAFRALHYLWLVLRGRHMGRPDVFHRRVRAATILSAAPVPYQLDGDPGGYLTPGPEGSLRVEILPGAVDVVLTEP